jgi:putative ABC transport system permease protein
MTTLLQDLRYGIRMLAKAPVVSAVAGLSLAVGIAANASVFAILNAFLLEPLPYHDQDGLVVLAARRQGESSQGFVNLSMADFRDFEAAASGLSGAMAYTVEQANLTGLDVPERIQVVVGTPNLFDVLGVRPALGRGFRAEEGAEGVGNVLVLEHDFWKRRFLGDPEVLGRTLTLDGRTHTVVGVMPEAFDMIPANVEAFRPTDFAAARDDRAARGYIAFGRLAPGASAATVQRQLDPVAQRLATAHPETNRGLDARVQTLREWFPGETDEQLTLVLAAVALASLLIACANVANLLLARAEERQKEVAVRTALGAGRHRILRQLLTESVTLGLAAGVLGVGLAVIVVRWLRGAMPAELPKAMIPALDPGVVLATLGVAVLAGIIFGLAPALHAVRADLREALGEGSRGGTASRSRRRLRNAFVVTEFAVALGLLTGAGFLREVFDQLTPDDPGIRQAGLLTFNLTVPEDHSPAPEDLVVYQDEILRRLAAVPGVQGVALMSSLPRGRMNPSTGYTVEGRPAPAEGQPPRAGLQAVNLEYFATMGIPLLRGRGIESSDRAGTEPVVVVSQALVDREFPGEDPLGRTVTFQGETRTIVGVAADILQDRIPGAGDLGETFYVPAAQNPRRSPSFAVRTAGDPEALAGDVRQAVWAVNPDQPIAQLRTLDAHVRESLAGPAAIGTFLAFMGIIALCLAAMGIYGVMAHAVAQQQREIGVRMALGASQGAVVGMVTRTGLTLAGVGMLLGLPLAFVMYRMAANIFNVFDAEVGLSYAAAATALLAVVAFVATWVPARRASGVQPVAALRD